MRHYISIAVLAAGCMVDDDDAVPESLQRVQIAAGIARVKQNVLDCKSSATGIVKLVVTVGPDGTVTAVQTRETPDAALGECAAKAVQQATFAKTRLGGRFTYPFVF